MAQYLGDRVRHFGDRAFDGHAPPAHGHGHAVQFYEGEDFLVAAIGRHLTDGIAAGQPLLVIATEPHRAAIARHLMAMGLDVAQASQTGQLTLLDARETLATFMVGSAPDPVRFRATLGRMLAQRLDGGHHTSIRAFGEMVDVLWRDGNPEGAIRLEGLWNELATTYAFSLLCAYDLRNFSREAHAPHFEAICREHGHVVPTERYTAIEDEARLLEIACLQQRARALEAEVEHRKSLERELRDALMQRDDLLVRAEAARAEAEAANHAKSQFLTVMSHELRTPLNAIGGHVQLVELGLYGPVTDAQMDALQRVQRSQRLLLALINDVLNLARVESGHVDYALADVALGPLVADVAATVAPLISAKCLTYEAACPAPLVGRADAEKLQQILLNLVTNAIKFTPEGGRITVTVERDVEAPSLVCLRVHDTGIGIARAKLETIFEPFVQVDRSRAPIEGVGLGLSISRHLARGMGGELAVESWPGVGSTFSVTLPVA